MGFQQRFAGISLAIACIGLILLALVATPVTSQIRSTHVELTTLTSSDEVLVHVRLPRGQTITEAVLTQDDNTLILEADAVPLPVTQWVLLDASDEMVNLQSVVQSNIQRVLRNSEDETGLIFFNSAVDVLRPTDRADQVEEFLTDYIATASEPACLTDALLPIADSVRPLDRSWRILLVTAGDFSRQTGCTATELPTMPAPVDVIAITDTIDPLLQTLVDGSNGSITTANLRTVEARINEIRTQWGQPTYALREVWPSGWDANATFDVTVTLANGTTETTSVRLGTYNVPPPPTPTVEPTPIVLDTIPPREIAAATEDTGALATGANTTPQTENTPDGSAPSTGGDSVAVLLIVSAVLFVIGAVVIALSLSRVRRAPARSPAENSGFYETLDTQQNQAEEAMGATKIRERSIIDDEDVAITRITPDGTTGRERGFNDDDEVGDEDDLLVTQVLTDDRFQQMMRQSRSDDAIVGYMRLITDSPDEQQDFPLTKRGAIIGRSQECDIQIRGDRAISRQHARLDVQPSGQVTVSRLSAVNPVVVDSMQVSNRHPLRPNDVIHLSDQTQLVFISKSDTSDDDETEI